MTSFFVSFGGEEGALEGALVGASLAVDPASRFMNAACKSRSTALLAFRSEFGEITC